MEVSPCPRTVWVLVGVADRDTQSFIRRRFGADVMVAGWLQPAS